MIMKANTHMTKLISRSIAMRVLRRCRLTAAATTKHAATGNDSISALLSAQRSSTLYNENCYHYCYYYYNMQCNAGYYLIFLLLARRASHIGLCVQAMCTL